SITFGSSPALNNNGSANIFIVKYDPSGTVIYSKSFGGTGFDQATGINTDASGNVYICGSFSSPSITFSTGTVTNIGLNDILLIKLNSSGTVLWAHGYGGADDDMAKSVKVDNLGNLLMTGYFQSSSVDFGSGPIPNYGTSWNMFLCKFSSTGSIAWVSSLGEEGVEVGNSIAIDNNNDVYVVGSFTSSIIHFLNTPYPNAGGSDIFVVKYSSLGVFSWFKSFGSSTNESCNGIVVDNLGSAYIIGSFFSSFMFGSTNLSTNGNEDIFYGKISTTSGSAVWGKNAGGSSYDVGYALTIDNSNNLYFTGEIGSPEAYFTNDTIINPTATTIFVAKYSITGNELWVKGLSGSVYGEGITADGSGNVYRTGSFNPAMIVGTTTLSSGGNADVFTAKIAQCNLTQPTITPNGPTSFCPGGSVTLNSSSSASYLWSNGATTQSINASTTNNYSVTITDINGCQNSNSINVTALQPYANELICEVNVDTALNKNFIVWEKTPNVGIATYKIYKESVAGGIYSSIGTSPFDSLSVFYDAASNPTVKSDRYKISVIDTCGNESATLSPAHKTLHLTVNQGMGNTINLIWENYEGFVFSSYYVYRGLSPSTLLPIDTIPNTITTYTDNTAPVGTFNYYQIVIAKSDSCVATKNSKTQTTQTFNTSVSNMEEYKIIGIDEYSNNNFQLNLYPNPVSNDGNIEYTLSSNSKVKLSIVNFIGDEVLVLRDEKQISGKHKISFSIPENGLAQGIYFIKLNVDGIVGIRKLIKTN
ncbi:MAG: T9SS type A sorting domain-containing protein, partial [Bacteroidetes bacterium]|nr:T9SS type A sorting domain-containing protein [Bacteroidota bacterium]